MNDHPNGAVLDRNLDRRLAYVFAVCINIEWNLGLDTQTSDRKVVHVANLQVSAEIDGWKQPKQFEGTHAADYADVK